MRKWVGRGAVVVAAIAGLAAAAPLPGSAAIPHDTLVNTSLLFYRTTGTPNAYRATVDNGIYKSNGPSTLLKGWTAAAVSRDTMMLYNKKTGAAVTGTFLQVRPPASRCISRTSPVRRRASCTTSAATRWRAPHGSSTVRTRSREPCRA